MHIVAPGPRRLLPLAIASVCVVAACGEAAPHALHKQSGPAPQSVRPSPTPVAVTDAAPATPATPATADPRTPTEEPASASSVTGSRSAPAATRERRGGAAPKGGNRDLPSAVGALGGGGGLGDLRGIGMGQGAGPGMVSGVGGLGIRGTGGGGGGTMTMKGIGTVGRGAAGFGSSSVQVGSAAGKVGHLGPMPPAPLPGGTFVHAGTNPIVDAREDPLSTFSIDVDTGSWFYGRRFLKMGRVPVSSSVRVEEWVNGLHYGYAGPENGEAFAIHVDAAPSPFTRDRHVVRVAIQGKRMQATERKPAHVTFLVDVSGSMASSDKLPWAQDAMRKAVSALRDDDTVAIATYAGATGLALPATSAREKQRIYEAIETLASGGGTNMGSGMELAYREANKHLGGGRTSRVFVLSDGDANIGRTSHADMLRSIRGYVSEGVTMSTVGFGTGNYNDHLMEQLADAGNGTYTYIDSEQTLKRVFVDELTSTLEVIAQDAKIQVEWDPNVVRTYRLLGYENRDIADQDFRNDKKDAGEIGAGHAVTALYEVELTTSAPSSNLGTVRVRHKLPRHTKAMETAVAITPARVRSAVGDLDADAKAALGMALAAEVLRGSEHAQGLTLSDAAALLRQSATGSSAAERNEAAALFERGPAEAVAQN